MRLLLWFLVVLVPWLVLTRFLVNLGWLSYQTLATRSQANEEPKAAFVLVAGLRRDGTPNPTYHTYLEYAYDWWNESGGQIWIFGGWDEHGLPPAWQAGKRFLESRGVPGIEIITPTLFGEHNVLTTQSEVQLALRAAQHFKVRPVVITNRLQAERVRLMFLWAGINPAIYPLDLSLIKRELGGMYWKYLIYERLMWWYAVWDPVGTGLLARREKQRRLKGKQPLRAT